LYALQQCRVFSVSGKKLEHVSKKILQRCKERKKAVEQQQPFPASVVLIDLVYRDAVKERLWNNSNHFQYPWY
jgi:hypothetical protein